MNSGGGRGGDGRMWEEGGQKEEEGQINKKGRC